MSAHEIATAAVQATRDTRANRSSARIAGAVLEALHRDGYAIVDLPAKRAGCTWPVGEDDDFTVTHVTLQRALDGATEVGAQISWGSLELNLSGADARSLAAALLAAAEHPGTPEGPVEK